MAITEKRLNRIAEVAARRQFNLTVVLENVHDSHNIGAVLRSCDSVGIAEIFVLHNEKNLVKDFLIVGKNTSSGSRKWVDVHYYEDTETCFKHVRSKYDIILGTHLSENAKSLYDIDLSGSIALVFGNEHAGITNETLAHLDGNFIIPQAGMVQSLNISVACAVSLYECYRQREQQGMYEGNAFPELSEKTRKDYITRHDDKFRGRAHELKKS